MRRGDGMQSSQPGKSSAVPCWFIYLPPPLPLPRSTCPHFPPSLSSVVSPRPFFCLEWPGKAVRKGFGRPHCSFLIIGHGVKIASATPYFLSAEEETLARKLTHRKHPALCFLVLTSALPLHRATLVRKVLRA